MVNWFCSAGVDLLRYSFHGSALCAISHQEDGHSFQSYFGKQGATTRNLWQPSFSECVMNYVLFILPLHMIRNLIEKLLFFCDTFIYSQLEEDATQLTEESKTNSADVWFCFLMCWKNFVSLNHRFPRKQCVYSCFAFLEDKSYCCIL